MKKKLMPNVKAVSKNETAAIAADLPGTDEHYHDYRVEATLLGINVIQLNDDGQHEHSLFVGFVEAVKQLDNGKYDQNLTLGRHIVAALGEGQQKGYFHMTAQQGMTAWRWVVAAAFVLDMTLENGTIPITDKQGNTENVPLYVGVGGGLPVYIAAERFAMANNIEGALIERYGSEQGAANATVFYMRMIDMEDGGLSEMGREMLAELHDSFIQQLQTKGIPDAWVAH